ncbi:MAG: CRTAC1 family protein [Phycisphaerae bacterium]
MTVSLETRSGRPASGDRVLFATLLVVGGMLTWTGCKREPPHDVVQADDYIPAVVTAPAAPAMHPLHFTDITAAAGIAFQHVTGAFGKKWMPETIGGGGAFLDYDGDGLPDILLVNGTYWPGHADGRDPPVSALFRNLGDGRFEDVTRVAGLDALRCYGMGAAIADYDGDGDHDVYITAVGQNHLLRNDGGRYVDVTERAGVGFGAGAGDAPGWQWSTGAAWLDYDRDGDLDLFVANYVRWTPETDVFYTRDGRTKSYATPEVYPGTTCVLFRNDGDDTFTDVTKQAGVFNPDGKSMSVVTDDFNGDGWPDIVVTNDTQPNFLYINGQDGTFADRALSAGVAYDEDGLARAGMGVSVADVNNSGMRSIAIGNFSGESLSLYTQVAAGVFVDRAGAAGLSKPTQVPLTFGVCFADLDLDGYEDLIQANGHIEPDIARVREGWTFAQRAQVFLNDRGGRFVDVSADAGAPFQREIVGRSAAVADIDGDGDLDVLLTTNGGGPMLLRNDLVPRRHVVRVRLRDAGMNRDGIGARVTATIGDVTCTRFIRTGGSYLSQSELVATLGLGSAAAVTRLEIRWPDGSTEQHRNLAAGAVYTIRRGAGVVATEPIRAP